MVVASKSEAFRKGNSGTAQMLFNTRNSLPEFRFGLAAKNVSTSLSFRCRNSWDLGRSTLEIRNDVLQVLWMDGIRSHHFETMGNKCIFVGIYRGIIIPSFVGWCKMEFVHPQYVYPKNTHTGMCRFVGGPTVLALCRQSTQEVSSRQPTAFHLAFTGWFL